ncbi:hypothetical protein D3C87_1348490 [compost metagenome]
MLASQQHFIGLSRLDERTVPRLPGGSLQAGAGLNLDANHRQRHSQRITDRLTMRRPRIGRSLKAVMDMDSA